MRVNLCCEKTWKNKLNYNQLVLFQVYEIFKLFSEC